MVLAHFVVGSRVPDYPAQLAPRNIVCFCCVIVFYILSETNARCILFPLFPSHLQLFKLILHFQKKNRPSFLLLFGSLCILKMFHPFPLGKVKAVKKTSVRMKYQLIA